MDERMAPWYQKNYLLHTVVMLKLALVPGRCGKGQQPAEERISGAVAQRAGAAGADALGAGGARQGGLHGAGAGERGEGGLQLGAWHHPRHLWSGRATGCQVGPSSSQGQALSEAAFKGCRVWISCRP